MTKHPDCLIDTNVVLRHVLNDDPKQAAAVQSVFDALRSVNRQPQMTRFGVQIDPLQQL